MANPVNTIKVIPFTQYINHSIVLGYLMIKHLFLLIKRNYICKRKHLGT